MAQGPHNPPGGEAPDDAALRARLGQLSSSLKQHDEKNAKPPTQTGDSGFGNAMGMALRVVAELVAGVVVGGGIGYGLDKWLNTRPVFLAVFILLGLVGGFWNTVRMTLLTPRGPSSGND